MVELRTTKWEMRSRRWETGRIKKPWIDPPAMRALRDETSTIASADKRQFPDQLTPIESPLGG